MYKYSNLTEDEIRQVLAHIRKAGKGAGDGKKAGDKADADGNKIQKSKRDPRLTAANFVKKLSGGTSRGTFLIDTTSGKFVISVFRRRKYQPIRVNSPEKSHKFQQFLYDNDMPVARLVGGLGVLQPSGSKFQIQQFIEGEYTEGLTAEQLAILGKTIAHLHITATGYKLPLKHKLHAHIHMAIRLVADFASPRRNGHIPVRSFLKTLAQIITLRSPSLYPAAMLHGGVRLPNLIINNDKITIIDFEGAHYAHLWRDIARPIGALCCDENRNSDQAEYKFNHDKAEAFLRAYHSIRPLTNDEIGITPGKALLFAERNITNDPASANMLLEERLAKLEAIEKGIAGLDIYKLLDIAGKQHASPGSGGKKFLGLRLYLTEKYGRFMNKMGVTTLRQLKDESLELSNKFNHPVTWDPYMKGGKGGFNRRGRDDARDAFRHAYAGGVNSYEVGRWLSVLLGDIRKIFSEHNREEKRMDMYNNRIGREIGAMVKKHHKGKPRLEIKRIIALEANKSLANGELKILNTDIKGPVLNK